jgi:predicted Zn-dependent protease
MPLMRFFHPALSLILGLALLTTPLTPAQAAESRIVIRDTEIENTIKTWSADVINAAGMTPEQVNIILIQNQDLNAFVAGGSNIFIYTGLIEKTENPGELVGVIAHELGHIAGGHLSRTSEVMGNASFEAIVATLLGVGAAIATRDGGAAAAGARIGQATAMNKFLAYSRVQESSADQAGFRFLDNAGINPVGLVTFLEKLSSQELLPTSQQSAFARSHPMSRDRIEALEARLPTAKSRNTPTPASLNEQHARMKAKLMGFITPQQVVYAYPEKNQTISGQYARAIAAYRTNKVDAALKGVNKLIAAEPDNPYFHEIKGQMLFDFGRTQDAAASYQRAIELAPSSGLIRTALGQALIESSGKNKEGLENAISHLKRAQQDEPRSSQVKRLLATAYGRLGQEPQARVYLAEEALLQGRTREARSMASSAMKLLPPGSPELQRARDVINSVDQKPKKD